jgi:hypothetical protein
MLVGESSWPPHSSRQAPAGRHLAGQMPLLTELKTAEDVISSVESPVHVMMIVMSTQTSVIRVTYPEPVEESVPYFFRPL